MPPRLAWSNLLPGLIAFAALIAVAVGVLVFAGVNRVDGNTMRLHVVTRQAQGVMTGTEVWLAGQKIGLVKRVEFRPPEADTLRVVLVLDVQEREAEQIRRDSRAEIRTGGTVIGPAVVYLTTGTPRGDRISEGDTLFAQGSADVASSGKKLVAIGEDAKPLLADVRALMARARRRRASVEGTLIEVHDGEVALRGRVSRFRGAFALPPAAGNTRAHAQTALARVDSLRALLRSPSTSLGRFRRDSSLGETLAAIREELSTVRAAMVSPEGNFGRLTQDSAMTRALSDAQREMTLLMDDFRRRPQRYIAF
ncbi:MAG: MlaD family protein [Gemmatimonadaceae bacterium]